MSAAFGRAHVFYLHPLLPQSFKKKAARIGFTTVLSVNMQA
jgi:hypothetical protein